MSIFPLPARTPAAVHPAAPRFSQAITGMLCLEAVIFQTQAVVVVAAVFIALALIGPRWSPWPTCSPCCRCARQSSSHRARCALRS